MSKAAKEREDQIYKIYLVTFACVRSGTSIIELLKTIYGEADLEGAAAFAYGANDGIDKALDGPMPRFIVLEAVNELLTAKKEQQKPCAVVKIDEK